MSKIRVVLEAAKSVHPMAVHAYPSEKGKFTVHATGSKVKHVKKGDTVSSSDLDDLSDAGHKVKEIKKPMKEEVESISELSPPVLARYVNKSHKDAMGNKAASRDYAMLGREATWQGDHKDAEEMKAKSEKYKKQADKRTKGIENATKRLAKEEAEQVDEKLTPEAKSAVRTALGPKTPGNQMRKSSQAARTLISVLKSNKKNVAEAEDAGSLKQKAIQKYIDQGYSYNDAVKKAEIYIKKKKLM